MEVRIGVTHTPKEIEVELAEDTDHDSLMSQIEEALRVDGTVLWLTDKRGRKVGVPVHSVAYIEIDSAHEDRRVGFGVP
ncbi:MAG: DUF3107 domain-containing protein [Actinobacteria bacterium]|nr:DUF3107 domain-containing protein [Actinomycetota bacterium]